MSYKKLLRLFGFILLFILPLCSFAGGGDIPTITQALQSLVDILTGTAARLMAIIAIAAVGYLWLTGRLSLKHAVVVGLSVGIIFGAPTIAGMLGAG
jgi:type IV secretion system protein VirB2